tara:strand:- start:87 stop:497 length:411 start_codon:yes stop_codon:yes gene_type:complete
MLEATLKKVYEELGTNLRWGWDERFRTALMVLQGDAAEHLNTRVGEVFDQVWSEENISGASSEVQHLVTYLSGLRDAQRLHTMILEDSAILFAALWPWAGNSHVSYRVGIFRAYGTPEETDASRKVVRTIFTSTDT